jgi:hypothetical protein
MTKKLKKKLVTNPNNKTAGVIYIGDKDQNLPESAWISITLGEQLNLGRMIVFTLLNQIVISQMRKSKEIMYAELYGDLKQGSGLTMTVFKRRTKPSFSNSGSHKWIVKFFRWLVYGGKTRSYFLSYSANGVIPEYEQALAIVKKHGRYFEDNKLIRKSSKPNLAESPHTVED